MTSINSVLRKIETDVAFKVLEQHKGLIDNGLIELEKQLAESGVSHPVRAATAIYYLTQVMFKFAASLACCEDSYKSGMERFAESLRADALKRANDPSEYRDVMRAMGKEPKRACHDEKAKPPVLN